MFYKDKVSYIIETITGTKKYDEANWKVVTILYLTYVSFNVQANVFQSVQENPSCCYKQILI